MDTDTMLGSQIDAFLSPEEGDRFELRAETRNVDLAGAVGAPEPSPKLWALIAYMPDWRTEGPHITLSYDRTSLESEIRARRYPRHELVEFDMDVPDEHFEATPSNISITYLSKLGIDGNLISRLWGARYISLGDISAGGARRLRDWGFGDRSIRRLRRAIQKVGLRLAPLREKKVA
jgi:hypothetical protein